MDEDNKIITKDNTDYLGWNEEEDKEELKIIEKYNIKLKKEILKSERRKRLQDIKNVRLQYRNRGVSRTTSTTKILITFIMVNCTLIEVYSMYVMYHLQDLSSLYSLIGAVVSESLSFGIYCAKAFNETTEEQKILLERDKLSGVFDDDTEPDPIPEDDDGSGDIPEGDTVMYEDHTY